LRPKSDSDKRILQRVDGAPEKEMSGISRLVIRRDGFVSVRAGYTAGEFLTPFLTFEGEQLVLNVDTSAVGQVKVEILDEDKKPIPGYTLEESDEIYTANETNRVVKWNQESSVAKLAGRSIRLRFVMRDVDLYAFQFRPLPHMYSRNSVKK